jgi:hypothetical protein
MLDIMWWLLMGLVAVSVLSPSTWPKATVHDPISALISGVVDLIAGGGGLLGGLFGAGDAAAAGAVGAGAAGADAFAGGAADLIGAGAGAAGAADAALPIAAASTLAPAAADIGGAAVADTALAGAAGGGAADVLGALGPGLGDLTSAAPALDFGGGGTAAGGAAGALPEAVPGANALSSVAPVGAASTPAAAAPPADFLAASSLADPTAATSGGAAAGGAPLSGPVAASGEAPFGTGDYGGGAAAGGHGILDKILPAGANSFIKDNKDLLTLGAAGVPLATMLFQGNPAMPGEKAATGNAGLLTNLAGEQAQQGRNLSAEGTALTGNAMSGVLPPGFEAAIEQAKNAATTKVGNTYGSLNLTGSTSEAIDKANVAASVDAQRATILNDLLTKGITASNAGTSALGAAGSSLGAAGNQDLALARLQLEQDQELQKALQSLASNLVLASIPARTTTTTTTG